jgi:hypothetical protein
VSVDALIVSALLVAASLPVAGWLWRRHSGGVRLLIALVAGAWIVAVFTVGRGMERADATEAAAPGRPIEVRSDGFTSSQACQSCHPDQYASWHDSYHRSMTQVASPESILAPFDSQVLELEGVFYRLERRADEFWMVTNDSRFREGADTSEHRIVLVTGSHHMQLYWFETGRGRAIARLPFFFRIREQRFIPMHAAFLAQASTPPGVPGLWNRVCLRCHSTHSVPKLQDHGMADTRVAELGIACESCHGPGDEHVRLNRDPLRRYAAHLGDGGDESIVNPARLDAQQSIDVCGRCHSVHSFAGVEAAMDWSENGISYKPGDALQDSLHVFRPGQSEEFPAVAFMARTQPDFFEDRFWPDGEVSIVGREYNGVSESPCFGGGEFTCTTCHQLHRSADDPRSPKEWANDQLADGMYGDAACTQCHPALAENVEAHTHHTAGSDGSRCMNCHMPHTAYGLLQSSRTHLVGSPDVATSLASGRPNACNLCHLDQTLGWSARWLDDWYGTPQPTIDQEDQRQLSDAMLNATRGHATQRALAAWHMGWAPAQQASGTDWMIPLLVEMLMDPYSAVRFIAHRSITTIPGYEAFEFDYLASPEERRATAMTIAAHWAQQPRAPQPEGLAARVPVDQHGGVDQALLARLRAGRDNRRIYLAE